MTTRDSPSDRLVARCGLAVVIEGKIQMNAPVFAGRGLVGGLLTA